VLAFPTNQKLNATANLRWQQAPLKRKPVGQMTSENKSQEGKAGSASIRKKQERDSDPEWTDGLRQLYDSVVDEPIPDSFRDLLDQLDDGDGD